MSVTLQTRAVLRVTAPLASVRLRYAVHRYNIFLNIVITLHNYKYRIFTYMYWKNHIRQNDFKIFLNTYLPLLCKNNGKVLKLYYAQTVTKKIILGIGYIINLHCSQWHFLFLHIFQKVVFFIRRTVMTNWRCYGVPLRGARHNCYVRFLQI